ncbi:MAG: DUF1559 domain-containing protein [Isosphaeraceae bacterium]
MESDDAIGSSPPSPAKPPAPRRRGCFGLSVFLVVLVGIGGVALSRAVNSAREAARRSACLCNLCAITVAMHNYHSEFGTFPPAHVRDRDGKPLYSWRVLILPYMDSTGLSDQFRRDEPWDSPANARLIARMPRIYLCPSRDTDRAERLGLTSYVAVTGPGSLFPHDRCVSIPDVKDGTAQTLMVVESDQVEIPWTAPVDLDVRTMSRTVNDPKRPGISSPHPGGANVAFADGSHRFLLDATPSDKVGALLTIDGGESVDREHLTRP